MQVGDTLRYFVPVSPGKSYRIQWDDFGEGSDAYSADVKVMVLDSFGVYFWFLNQDHGYSTVQEVSASEREFQVRVICKQSGYFRIRVLELVPQGTSSSSGSSPTFSSSGNSSSSSSFGATQPRLVLHDWSLSENYVRDSYEFLNDTLAYRVGLSANTQYQLQCFGSYLGNRSSALKIPVKMLDVSIQSLVPGFAHDCQVGAPSLLSVSQSGDYQIKILPSGINVVSFRLFEYLSPQVLSASVGESWITDTLDFLSDTIIYKFPVTAGTTYQLQVWDEDENNLLFGSPANVKFNFKSANGSLWPSLASDFYMFSYATPKRLVAMSDTLWVKVAGQYSTRGTGAFSLRLQDATPAPAELLLPTLVWREDTLASTADTIVYKVPTIPGKKYWQQGDNISHAGGSYSASVRFWYKAKNGVAWSGNWSGGYSYPMFFDASEDTTLIKVALESAPQALGNFGVRVYGVATRTVNASPSSSWIKDTLWAPFDTVIYRVSVNSGKRYNYYLSDSEDGSSLIGNSANMVVGYSQQSSWNLGDGSYSVAHVCVPDSQVLEFRAYSEGNYSMGAFGFKIEEILTTFEKQLPLGLQWTLDSIGSGDTIVYKVPVASNTSYRIQWDDGGQGSGAYSTNMTMLQKELGAASWSVGNLDGYNTMVTATTSSSADTLLVKMIGQLASSYGRFAIRVFPRIPEVRILGLGMQWHLDSLQGSDTVEFHIPTQAGKEYRVQMANQSFQPSDFHFTAQASVRAYTAPGVAWPWFHYVDGSASYGQYEAYNVARKIVATGDSIIVRIQSGLGTFGLRVYESSLLKRERVLRVGDPFYPDTIDDGDSLVFKVPCEVGKQYRVIWDNALEGSGAYTSKIMVMPVWQRGWSTGFMGPSYYGYTSKVISTPATGDTLFVQVAAGEGANQNGSGSFALRVEEFVLVSTPLAVSKIMWTEGAVPSLTSEIIYKVAITVGKTYRVKWDDGYGSGAYSGVLGVSFSNDGYHWNSEYTYGYFSLKTYTPLGSFMYIRARPVTLENGGTFAIQVFPYP
jgi:hypothetical protein